MMKKRRLSVFVIVLIVIMGIASIQSTQAHERRVGERLGDVLNTDIRVFINDVQIMGYNIGGHTYVVVEDLRAYGFVVVWDGITRALHISKGASSEQARIIPDNLQPVGSVAFPFLYSDIVTYIGSERISSFNVDGSTVTRINYIADAFGRYVWDGAKRELRVFVDGEAASIGQIPTIAQPTTPTPTQAPTLAPTTPPPTPSPTTPPPATPTTAAQATQNRPAIVFWVPNGTVWHSTPNCRSLARSRDIRSGPTPPASITRRCSNC